MYGFRRTVRGGRILPLGLAVGLGLAGCSRPGKVSKVSTVEPDIAGERIRAEQISAHIGSLAGHLRSGKDASASACAPVVEYAAGQFHALGLKAAGLDGYLQAVPLRRTEPVGGRCLFRPAGSREQVALKRNEDFALLPNVVRQDAGVAGKVMFAGFGITAPQLDYDDYKGTDARGRIVVVLSGAPRFFPPEIQARYSAPEVVLENAAVHGAGGVLVVDTQRGEELPWLELLGAVDRGRTHWLDAKKAPHGPWSRITGAALLSKSGAGALFAAGRSSLDEVMAEADTGSARAFDLPLQMNLRTSSRHFDADGRNVIAVLPGSDPVLRDEYVLYASALACGGVSDVPEGDEGQTWIRAKVAPTAALLEIARAFSTLAERPRRSILFLVGAMEGPGWLGPDYFAHNPTVPAERIVTSIANGLVAGGNQPPEGAKEGAQRIGGERDLIWRWCGDAGPAIGSGSAPPADPGAWAELARLDFAAIRQAANEPPRPK